MFRLAGTAALIIVIFLLIAEIAAAIVFEFGLVPVKYRPVIWATRADVPPADSWRTENHPWGAWHKADAQGSDRRSCYSVVYASNEVGARDDSWNLPRHGIPTVFGLGDSFLEGYGVVQEDRFDTIVESQGFDFLNFGAAGHVGPVQYYLIYEHFADTYDHDAVVIFFLPDNDYSDNDPEVWEAKRNSYAYRYRPYFRASGDGKYEVFHPVDEPPGEITFRDWQYKDLGIFQFIANFGRDFTYTYGAVMYAMTLLEEREFDESGFSGYYDAEPHQLQAAHHFLGRIAKRAAARNGMPVIIFSIPTTRDFRRAAIETDEASSSRMLRSLAADNPNVYFIDGLTAMTAVEPDTDRYFLPCDGHWSKAGHEIVGQVVANALSAALQPAMVAE